MVGRMVCLESINPHKWIGKVVLLQLQASHYGMEGYDDGSGHVAL